MQEYSCLVVEKLASHFVSVFVQVAHIYSQRSPDHAPDVWEAKAQLPRPLVREGLSEEFGVDEGLVVMRTQQKGLFLCLRPNLFVLEFLGLRMQPHLILAIMARKYLLVNCKDTDR